jgi:hypothetical protein
MISRTSFCYKERVGRLAWLGAFSVAALGLTTQVAASRVSAQGEPEPVIITEPPAETEPPLEAEPPTEEPLLGELPPGEPPPPEDTLPTGESPKKPPGHLRVGGGIGLGFASDFIAVGVSPQVSYIFKRIVEPGVAFRYEFSKDRLPDPDAIRHTYGGSLFVRIFPIQQLFFLVEGELINTGVKQGGIRFERQNYGNLLLGGGFLMGVGRGAFFGTSIKFAVLRNPFYPTAFPIISVGGGYAF